MIDGQKKKEIKDICDKLMIPLRGKKIPDLANADYDKIRAVFDAFTTSGKGKKAAKKEVMDILEIK
jgi:hypothetical protein